MAYLRKLIRGAAGSAGKTCKNFIFRNYFNMNETRELLSQYGGGSIDLLKDEASGIATITLNNPARRNAITGTMMLDLEDVVSELEKWTDGKGVLLCGSKNTFCSGGDLKLVSSLMEPTNGVKICVFMQNTLSRLFNLPLISMALLQGQVLGGGAELATACDFRIVTENVSIGFVQAKMGLTTGWGGGTRLVQLLGRTLALDLLISARILSGQEVCDIGLAQGLIPEDNAHEHAKTWLINRIPNDVILVRSAKAVVMNACEHSAEVSLRKEKDIFGTVWGGEHHHRAMKSNIRHKKSH